MGRTVPFTNGILSIVGTLPATGAEINQGLRMQLPKPKVYVGCVSRRGKGSFLDFHLVNWHNIQSVEGHSTINSLPSCCLPSGKLTVCYGKSPCLMGTSTIKWPFSIANCWHHQRLRMKLCPLSLRLCDTAGSDGCYLDSVQHPIAKNQRWW